MERKPKTVRVELTGIYIMPEDTYKRIIDDMLRREAGFCSTRGVTKVGGSTRILAEPYISPEKLEVTARINYWIRVSTKNDPVPWDELTKETQEEERDIIRRLLWAMQ